MWVQYIVRELGEFLCCYGRHFIGEPMPQPGVGHADVQVCIPYVEAVRVASAGVTADIIEEEEKAA